jgi:uncharacterized protein with gpF-like domain
MKFTQWQIRRLIEINYQRALKAFMDKMMVRSMNPKSGDPVQMLAEWQEAFNDKGFSDTLNDFANRSAANMVTGVYSESARTWREAARQGMQGRRIFEMLKTELEGPVGVRVQELVRRNAELISSLPGDVAADANKFIQEMAMQGARAKTIQAELKRMPTVEQVQERVKELTDTRIALIARTETSKASTALTRARSEELDIDWYMWRTSKDARVRRSHQLMDRVLIAWSDAPSPEQLANVKSTLGHYHAGDCPNCRCYTQPVVSINRIEWPAKVYVSGQITRMTRYQFEKMLNPLQRAA